MDLNSLKTRIALGSALFAAVVIAGIIVGLTAHTEQDLLPNSTWSPWTTTSPCSATCGGGVVVRARSRTCMGNPGCPRPESQEETVACASDPCPPVFGEWGQWVRGKCSELCGGGNATLSRQRYVKHRSPFNSFIITSHPFFQVLPRRLQLPLEPDRYRDLYRAVQRAALRHVRGPRPPLLLAQRVRLLLGL